APERECAHAVAGGHDPVEVLKQSTPGKPVVDPLADLVVTLDVERDAENRAEGAQADDETVEVVIAARDGDDLAVRAQELERRDGGGQVADAVSGPVRGRLHGARDRDVWQRGQVRQRQTRLLQSLGQFAVANAAAEPDARRLGEDLATRGKRQEGDKLGRVADRGERMTWAQDM